MLSFDRSRRQSDACSPSLPPARVDARYSCLVPRPLVCLVPSILFLASCAHEPPPRATSDASLLDAIELVESAPVETTLDHPDIPNASDVWLAMIAGARERIDFAELYASEADGAHLAGSRLAPIVAAVEAAVRRGVRVRFINDARFAEKYPETTARLEKAGVTVRTLDFSTRGGGVLHAKYFVIDGHDSFVGSQNFDWRSLSHIQEIGVRVRSRTFAATLLEVFDADFAMASGAALTRPPAHSHTAVPTRGGEHLTLVASPKGMLPDEAAWDLPRLVGMIGAATRTIDVQVLTYKAKNRDGTPFLVLDDALRSAAARGLKVRLLVSEWAEKESGRASLDGLAKAGVAVRVLVVPPWSGGEIPFARVAHAKYMVTDGAHAWVGTSNWEGDYFSKSRNVGVVAMGGALPVRLAQVFEDGWSSAYTHPLTGP